MAKMGPPIKYADSDNIVADTRRQLALKQSDFAALLDVTPMAVSQWENNKRAIPGPVRILCKLLQRDPNILPI